MDDYKEKLLAELKLVSADDAAVTMQGYRRKGLRIVFTNGCFDLLHPGHLSTIAFAASKGDILVLGLNSDASIRRLKGEGRPIMDQVSRASVLAEFSRIDYIIIFEEDTPEELIRKLRPDVLVKGADWSDKSKIAGSAFVESYGGKTLLVPTVRGHSTTGIVGRMRETLKLKSD
jgi:D-beta-D-heptose 7-phosphate kinase/D-beta-D-heptose 1-phosphate adenosyltransferase